MNDVIANFHFIRPELLWLCLPAIILAALLFISAKSETDWNSIIDSQLLQPLIQGNEKRSARWAMTGLLLLWLVSIFAIAGPTWEKQQQPVSKDVEALVILWDLSPSMNATDLLPSRYERSRLKLIDLLNTRKEGLTGLIAYSGEAHIITPLTDDTKTIVSILGGLSPEIMPASGSNAEMALELAHQLLTDSSIASGKILFVTDGIAADAMGRLHDIHSNSSHKISIWGIGTDGGAPIPLGAQGFAKNNAGEIVIAKLDSNLLSEIAIELGGFYVPFSNDNLDVDTIDSFSRDFFSTETRESDRQFDIWVEYGPYFVILLLPFAALAFRKGWLMVLPFTLILISPTHVEANTFWKNKNQQAQTALQEGDAESAAKLFDDREWKGVAEYKNKNFEDAATLFSENQSARGQFNLGNSLAHGGKYDEAISAYERSLSLDPNNQLTKDNIEIVKKIKQLQEQQNQQQNGESDPSDNSEQNQDGGESNEQNQSASNANQNQDSESQDGKNQESQNNESDPQNSESQNQKNDQQREAEEQSSQDSASQNTTSEQQSALEQQYGEEKDEPENSKAQALKENKEQAEESDQNSQEQAQLTQTFNPIQAEQTEEQQALEQWLRKVPDDPTGLLRNKLKHEYQVRQRSNNQQIRRTSPIGNSEQRW